MEKWFRDGLITCSVASGYIVKIARQNRHHQLPESHRRIDLPQIARQFILTMPSVISTVANIGFQNTFSWLRVLHKADNLDLLKFVWQSQLSALWSSI